MKFAVGFVLMTAALSAQTTFWMDGLWQGYDGELTHVSRQVVALVEAMPQEQFSYRPAPGVRTFSEVCMHLAISNLALLSVTGPKMPKELTMESEKITSKAQVVAWMKRSFEAVKIEHAKQQPADLARKVKVEKTDATVEGMYLRILVHANEHMGQLIAYARAVGVKPPWSGKEGYN